MVKPWAQMKSPAKNLPKKEKGKYERAEKKSARKGIQSSSQWRRHPHICLESVRNIHQKLEGWGSMDREL